MSEFTPPIREVAIASSDEGGQSYALTVWDAIGTQFSLLVQTQRRFSAEVLAEPETADSHEPVFMIDQPVIDPDTLGRVIGRVDPVLLGRFLVLQTEE